ncbi:MAG: ATP-binding protein [Candidatus Hodarchaeales archaeon]|jgi:signal transduction histidine kinase
MSDLDKILGDLIPKSPLSVWKQDLSDLKKYLDSLKKKTDNIRKYFDENPSEIMKCAQLVKVFDVNKSMMELIEEESRDELLGSFLKHLVLPSTVPPFKEALIELSEGKLQSIVEGYTLTKKGKLIYLKYLTYIPEKFALTWKEAWVLVFDLTEYKTKELMLNEKASKNEFLIDLLTHDLRNFHHLTLSYLDILLSGKVNQHEDTLNYLSKANTSIRRANKLLDNVSVLMKTYITKEIELHSIELKPVLVKTKEFLMNLYPYQKIVVSIESIPDKLFVHADSFIEYLFINLFTNAVKHNQNEVKQIEVTVSQDDGDCSISIIDNAKGIPVEKREKIFSTRYSEFKKR